MVDNQEEHVWEWDKPTTIDEELESEALFHRIFEHLRERVRNEETAVLLENQEDIVRMFTALFDVAEVLINTVATGTETDPQVVIDGLESGRPRGQVIEG